MPKSLFLFNPLALPKQTLIDNFVIRKALMQSIFDLIEREAFSKKSSQHLVILGERGMGKTTLLARLKYKIEQSEKLNKRLIPIIFSEEQPSVKNLATFWELLIPAVETALDLRPDSLNMQIKGYYYDSQKKNQYKEKDFAEYIYTLIFDLVAKQNKKIILFADNFHLILKVLAEQEQQRLREILTTSPYIQIIGATPIVLPENIDYIKPFFDFFRIERLDILNEAESLTLLKHYSAENHIVKKILTEEPKRIELIRRTTGGNVRSMLMFYELLDEKKTFDAYESLNDLLNGLTPFYNLRIDDLGKEKRAIVNAIALRWDGIKIKEIAEAVRENSNIVSAHLKQLEMAGVVEYYKIVKEGGIRPQALYQLTDRMLNIWYLMRYGNQSNVQRVLWFLKMIEAWLGKDYDRSWVNSIITNIDEKEGVGSQIQKIITEIIETFNKKREGASNYSESNSDIIPILSTSKATIQKHSDILSLSIPIPLKTALYESTLSLNDKERLYQICQENPNNDKIIPALAKAQENVLAFAKENFPAYWMENEKVSEYICLSYYLANNQHNFELADYYLQKTHQDAPKIGDFLRNEKLLEFIGKGYINLANKDKDQAESYFEKALLCGYVRTYSERAEYYKNKKVYQKAFDDYFQAYRHKIDLSQTTFQLGVLAADYLKNYENAIYFYEENKKYDTNKFTNFNLGWAYYHRKEFDKAIEELKIAFEKEIQNSCHALGCVYSRKYQHTNKIEDFIEAEKWYKLGIEKNEISSMNGLAWTYYELGMQDKKEEALSLMQKMEATGQMNKDKSYLWHTYGTILLWNDKVKEANNITTEHFLYDTALMDEDYSDFVEYLLMLCARSEYDFLLEYFTGSRGSELQTKDRFSAIYFVLMKLMNNDEEYERMRPELKETVEEMLESVADKKQKYCL